MRRLARTAWHVASTGVLVLVVAFLALIALPRTFGGTTVVVETASMVGTAPTGSAVVLRPISAGNVNVGDIILVQRSRVGMRLMPVLHRVIARRIASGGQVVVRTKGDASEAPDPDPYIVPGRTYTPAVIFPRLGYAVAFLSTVRGWFGFVIAPTVLIAAIYLTRLWTTEESLAPSLT